MSRILLSVGKTNSLIPYFDHLIWMSENGKDGPYKEGIGYGIYFDNQIKIIKKLEPFYEKKKNDIFGTAFIGYCASGSDLSSDISLNSVQPYTSDMLLFVSDIRTNNKEGNIPNLAFRYLLKGFPNFIANFRQMDFEAIVFLMTDGRYAAAYREVRRDWGLHSLFYHIDDDRFTISSEEMHGKWYELEDKTLLIFRDGKIREYSVKEEIPHVL